MPFELPKSGVKYIRVNRYDNNGEDIATTIKYARSIRVNHGARIRQYDIKSVVLDPTVNNVYYLEVSTNFESQPVGGANKDVALVPAVEFDLEYNEYNALFSNANDNQESRTRYQVIRDTLAGTPSNVLNIVNRRERLAELQDDLYTDVGLANGRFEGSKNTSTDINVYKAGDNSIYQMPAVDLTQDYFAYFKYIGGTSPEIPNKVAADIKYFIGPSGSIIDTKSDPEAAYLLKENFEQNSTVVVNLDDPKFGGTDMSSLNGPQEVLVSGKYSAPITNNHFPAMPSNISSGSTRYGTHIVYKNRDTDSLVAANIFTTLASVNPFTSNLATGSTYWITGSSDLTTSISGSVLYDNDNYYQVGVGITSYPYGSYFTDWVATGELEEAQDYLEDVNVEGISMDILFTDATGFGSIRDKFKINQYDYITFHSKRFDNWRDTFQVLEVNYNSSNNEVYLRLNKPIIIKTINSKVVFQDHHNDRFSITRYKDSATLLTLDTDKLPGGTSGGIIKPKYVSEEAEKSIMKTIGDMRQKGMI